jgi:hypothetical protein
LPTLTPRSHQLSSSTSGRFNNSTAPLPGLAISGKSAFDLASQMHQDRLACLAAHFGEYYRGPGDPDAEHAQRWIDEHVDPRGLFAPEPAEVPLPVESVSYSEVVYDRPVSTTAGKRRVGGNTAIMRGADPPRRTFVPTNAEEFMAAKRQGIFGNAETGRP